MKRHRGAFAVRVAELFVRTALTHLDEAKGNQNGDDLARLEDGYVSHSSGNRDVLNPDELGFELGLAVFEKHADDFLEVAVELVERFALRMRARKARNETDKQPGLRAPFNHRGIDSHGFLRSLCQGAIIGLAEADGNLIGRMWS